MGDDGYIVFNADDPQLIMAVEGHDSKLAPFSMMRTGLIFHRFKKY